MTDKDQQIATLLEKLTAYGNACFDCGDWDGENGDEYKGWNDRANSAKQDVVTLFKQALAATAPSAQGQEKVDELSAVALSLYKPPFKFVRGYIYDSANEMVADNDGQDVALRVRGWGRIGYMKNAEKVQDKVGELIAQALTEYWQARAALRSE